jgi:hypothetical protein
MINERSCRATGQHEAFERPTSEGVRSWEGRAKLQVMPNTIRHVDHQNQLRHNAPEPNRHLRPMIKGKPRFFWNSIQQPACIDTEFQLRQDWSHEHNSLGIDSDKCRLGGALYASIVAWHHRHNHNHDHGHHNRTGQVHVDLFGYSVALGASSQRTTVKLYTDSTGRDC